MNGDTSRSEEMFQYIGRVTRVDELTSPGRRFEVAYQGDGKAQEASLCVYGDHRVLLMEREGGVATNTTVCTPRREPEVDDMIAFSLDPTPCWVYEDDVRRFEAQIKKYASSP